ncbi:MAG: transglycosylase domain-containing protein, partial [Actinomycetota bacterium]|nr:transglycosylase domain-containing protein [Actinomycetota bacterium]
MGKFGRLAGAVLLSGFGMAVVAGVVVVGLKVLAEPGWKAKTTTTDLADLQPLATRSVVYARDGSVLTRWHAEEDRLPVPLERVPPHVVRAVLDAEDDRFFEHGAIDLRALGRALAVNVESGSVSEGGSTITQQLVKVSLLGSKQNLERKVQEVALALRLESGSTKEQILERYLNTVYFGNGAYGLQAAAERYFGTDVDKLTMGQGVLLASLIRNPVRADPYIDGGTRAIERRAAVVDR